jgi:hypothetical protein
MGILVLSSATSPAGASPETEDESGAFKSEGDRTSTSKRGVLFVGSSSIKLWRTRIYFPTLPCTNVGAFGFHISDVNHSVARIVYPHEPKVIIFYAGDNDIAAGMSPEKVLFDYQQFVHRVRQHLPDTSIVFISIKPSVLRQSQWARMRQANRLIEDFCRSDEHLSYADVATPMLDAMGSPRRDLFAPDGLHLNAEGYRLWTGIVSPIIELAYHES